MRKLKLSIEDLAVESLVTGETGGIRGTVRGAITYNPQPENKQPLQNDWGDMGGGGGGGVYPGGGPAYASWDFIVNTCLATCDGGGTCPALYCPAPTGWNTCGSSCGCTGVPGSDGVCA
jgi:hypothetical protein